MSEALVAEIQAALGPRGWLDPADAGSALTGWRGTYSGTPVLVARPDTVGGVQEVVRTCARHGAAVVTQGGNTGLAGGSVPIDDLSDGRPSVLLLTTRLNRITSVDPARFTVTAEAGCTIEQVQQAAAAADRQLAMDWGARGSATVGGAISTNAGGLNVLRYGNTRRHVLGLEAVLADGRVFDGLRALRKDNTGYDLKHLFIGAEGTLGVVTRAVLELQPAMPHHRSLFASLTGLDVVTDLYGLARSIDPGGLTAFELVPEMGVGVAVDVLDVVRPIDTRSEWYLLARFSGSEPVTDTVTRFLTEAVERGYATDAVVAETASQEANLWTLRDELPPEMLFDSRGAKFDAAVPIDRIPEFQRSVEAIAARLCGPEAVTFSFGHLGDGNLHVYVLPSLEHGGRLAPDLVGSVTAAVDEVIWDLGGTISAEHGIGQDLLARLPGQKSQVEFDLMRSVKAALDPTDIFNPGKGAQTIERSTRSAARSGQDEVEA